MFHAGRHSEEWEAKRKGSIPKRTVHLEGERGRERGRERERERGEGEREGEREKEREKEKESRPTAPSV